jgi:RNA polymerase sigma-B factor
VTSASSWGPKQRERERELLRDLSDLPDDDPRRADVRDELVTMHLPLVQHLARRYQGRGETLDDLVQVGTVGLIQAVDRFDVTRGTEFSTFATPTILGEIRRHFRDRTWAVRVPRGLQELQARVTTTAEALTADLHRAPTVRELAEALDVPMDDVLAALEARHAYSTDSIDADPDDEGSALSGRIGEIDPAFDAIEEREALRPLLAALPARDQRIIALRFGQNMSQTQIAEELGISQMQVSRLLARSLADLRAGLADSA